MYERALTILVKILGPQHPNTRTLLQNFSLLYKAQGRDKEAERLLRDGQPLREASSDISTTKTER